MHMVKGTYCADENQFLAIPHEVVKPCDPDVQALIRYSVIQLYLSYVEIADHIKLLSNNAASQLAGYHFRRA